MDLLNKFKKKYGGSIKTDNTETIYTFTPEKEIYYSIAQQVVVKLETFFTDDSEQAFEGIRI